MRIAIVSPEFPPAVGGVETYAFEFVKELATRGHEVTVFTVRHPRGETKLPGVRIEPVLKLCRSADSRTLGSFAADVWHALNAAYAWIAHDRPNNVVTVHGNDFLRPYYPIAQPDMRRIPWVWRWSDQSSSSLRPLWVRLSSRLVTRTLPYARHIITNSRYTERVLLERFPACRGRTSTGLVGVAAQFFDVEPRPAADGVARLLTVCRLSESRKNVDRVLHALARLKDNYGFQYTVVGDGHDRVRLEKLASDLRLGERVCFTGFVSMKDLLDIYAQADLMVLASSIIRGSHEGFGIVYLEAAASGVPSLAAHLAGATEAVGEGVSGIFVEDPTVDALTAKLEEFLAGRVRFDPNACRNFARPFTWARVVDHAVQHYT